MEDLEGIDERSLLTEHWKHPCTEVDLLWNSSYFCIKEDLQHGLKYNSSHKFHDTFLIVTMTVFVGYTSQRFIYLFSRWAIYYFSKDKVVLLCYFYQ